ncbi:uncharacterized protein [Elaeis guineensis]|uniref:Uncharacterized protein LOC105053927 n=1 Tax=Elaeis guineensis var. tenera TaxID=51953 RepID=A0A6I9RWL4_ELAGV|nr:uncharacterized protein LOC105053927 [Elaeis guineensis]
MDPFASIGDEVGQPSDSQEDRLLHSNLINVSPVPYSLPPADASSGAAGCAGGLDLPKVDDKGKSPAVAGEAPNGGHEIPGPSKRCKMKSCASRRRRGGIQIRSSTSPGGTPPDGDGEFGFGEPSSRPDQEDGMRLENPQSDPNAQASTSMNPDFAAEVVPGSRKLPASIRNPPPAEGNEGSSSSAAGGRNSPPSIPRAVVSVAEGSLLDVIKMFSETPSRRFADVDLLEILDMKGAAFRPPQWWRPEGYGD